MEKRALGSKQWKPYWFRLEIVPAVPLPQKIKPNQLKELEEAYNAGTRDGQEEAKFEQNEPPPLPDAPPPLPSLNPSTSPDMYKWVLRYYTTGSSDDPTITDGILEVKDDDKEDKVPKVS